MAIWLFRAGRVGEYENKFLNENRVYLTWDNLDVNLKSFENRNTLLKGLLDFYSQNHENTVRNWTSQIWAMAHEIKVGDWVVMPSKIKSTIHIGEVKGDYVYDTTATNPYYHHRKVEWFAPDIPRANFDQDILYSFGAFLTVCRITRNDSERRIKEMSRDNWQSKSITTNTFDNSIEASETEIDLEELSNDSITKILSQKFKGHKMALLIQSILKAKGYITYLSPEGKDKGVDILAAPDPMGFGTPKLCVQVKTGDRVIRPVLDQLIGSMQNFKADHGLLVSWGGFTKDVEKEIPTQFFKVRLWGVKEIIDELLTNYEKLDQDIKAEIPLKRAWILSNQT